MVQPVIPPSVPVNAALPTLVAVRPTEQLRNTGVRPSTAQGVSASDEDEAVSAQNPRADQEKINGRQQSNGRNDPRRGNLDLTV